MRPKACLMQCILPSLVTSFRKKGFFMWNSRKYIWYRAIKFCLLSWQYIFCLPNRTHLSSNLFFLYIFGMEISTHSPCTNKIWIVVLIWMIKLVVYLLSTRKACWRGRRKFCSVAFIYFNWCWSKSCFMADSPEECCFCWCFWCSLRTVCC